MISLKGRSFLTLKDYSKDEIFALLDLAKSLKAKKKKGIHDKLLKNRNIAMIFEKTSTRTRCSFAVASADEGAFCEYLGINDIHFGSKESVADTARVLGRMFDCIVYRGFGQKIVEDLARYSGISVLNALTDDEHPTQVLADFLTIRERFDTLKVRFAYVGDGRNNVSNALMIGASKVGMDFSVISPKTLFPNEDLVSYCKEEAEKSGGSINVTDVVDFTGFDVIYTDVWVSMGEEEKSADRLALLRPYSVTESLMSQANKDAIFMHCLPAVKGNEVTEEVFESAQSVVFDEAENRMHTIKAVLVALLGNI